MARGFAESRKVLLGLALLLGPVRAGFAQNMFEPWWSVVPPPSGYSRPQPAALCPIDNQLHAGEGTFYDYATAGGGNCGFPTAPNDPLVGAMNQADYGNAQACGACVAVDGPNGSVTVRIVDRCPECRPGDVDLSPEAFARLAPPVAGRVPVRWRYVACPVAGPLVYHFKDGSNPWWTAVQVRNHRTPVAALEVRGPDGRYRALPRVDYNYFIAENGLGRGPYAVRVTDVLGRVVEDAGVPSLSNSDVAGTGQFAGCGG